MFSRCEGRIHEILRQQIPSHLEIFLQSNQHTSISNSYFSALKAVLRNTSGVEQHGNVSSISYPNRFAELDNLSRNISKIKNVKFSDIAIIVPKWSDMNDVISALAIRGIPSWTPFNSHYKSTWSKNESIRVVFSAFRCILYPNEQPPLLLLLQCCPAYKLPDSVLSRILEIHLSRCLINS